ncbi:hypothetical protein K504DRAFT_189315 [Pleomassaria siparia CBS 279.74]|uniref:Uncharacterized protein n=1 Tax=Pleomassaria siparia CBS 279.74 TaxID=1314801 RepID=A0A6G1JQN5_9PLEO|nr:hypothetical protein K504DRAFT_189315 [Pleomassaria siparia CBS 279.74]
MESTKATTGGGALPITAATVTTQTETRTVDNTTTATTTPPPTSTSQTQATAPQPEPEPQPQPEIQTQTQATTAQTLGYREKLDAGEENWKWKLGLRVALVVVVIIGTGCVGGAMVQIVQPSESYWMSYDLWLLWPALITFGVSFIWCLICILVLLLRRPPRPVHPGVAVGMDLVLWMGYIITTWLVVSACISALTLGSDGAIDSYSSYGYYTQASNGTWDNALYTAIKKKAGIEVTAAVCQGLALVLHFALFVWACVDTHRRRRSKTSVDAEKLAAEIIGRMVRDGAIIQAPGQAAQQQQPPPPQGWRYQQLPNQNQHMGQQQQLYQNQNQNPQYTVHQGPPPPIGQHPAMRGNQTVGDVSAIVEYYGGENASGGPAPPQQAATVEYYNEKSGPRHAI